MKNPSILEIHFENIKQFKKHCKINKIKPIYRLIKKKHKNRKDQFLHELEGSYEINSNIYNFIVDDLFVLNNQNILKF